MAPCPPTTRPPHRQPTRPSSLANPHRTPHKSTKAPTKELKRTQKHSALLTRITKSAPGHKISKRRRPSKKLVTNLDGLGDALPAIPREKTKRLGTGDSKGEEGTMIKHKSLKSRPGANKKKEKLVAMEMERFAKNMALMSGGSSRVEGQEMVGIESRGKGEGVRSGTAERWAAIRGFIGQTMERRVDREGAVGS